LSQLVQFVSDFLFLSDAGRRWRSKDNRSAGRFAARQSFWKTSDLGEFWSMRVGLEHLKVLDPLATFILNGGDLLSVGPKSTAIRMPEFEESHPESESSVSLTADPKLGGTQW